MPATSIFTSKDVHPYLISLTSYPFGIAKVQLYFMIREKRAPPSRHENAGRATLYLFDHTPVKHCLWIAPFHNICHKTGHLSHLGKSETMTIILIKGYKSHMDGSIPFKLKAYPFCPSLGCLIQRTLPHFDMTFTATAALSNIVLIFD
jgi:hypothetical protein